MKNKKLKIIIALILVTLIALFGIYLAGSEKRIKRFLEEKYPGYTFTCLKIDSRYDRLGDHVYEVEGFDSPVTVRVTNEFPLDLEDDFLQIRYERQIFEDDARIFSEVAGENYLFTTLHYTGWCRDGVLTWEYNDRNEFILLMPTNDSDMSFEEFIAYPGCGLEASAYILVDDLNDFDRDAFLDDLSHSFGRNNRYYSQVHIYITDEEDAFAEAVEEHDIHVRHENNLLVLSGNTDDTGNLVSYTWNCYSGQW